MNVPPLAEKHAFGYLRVSGKGQVDGDGFPRQRLKIEAYAAAHGFKIVEWFEEKGVCGAIEGLERPAWSTMVDACEPDTVIVIECLNRLARDLMVQEAALKDARNRNIQVISTDPMEADLDSSEPSRKFIRQVMGAVAEYDKAQIVAKLKGARERTKAKTGRCEGGKPYGFFPNEQPILVKMKTLRDQGKGYQEIAQILNHSHLLARGGKYWNRGSIYNALNPERRSILKARRQELAVSAH